MEIISRKIYIDRIMRYLDKGLMIALTGQRRVGKSYMLREVAQSILHDNPDANVVYINKEKVAFSFIKNDADLSAYLVGKLQDGAANYLLIDEVQDIDGFENTLRSLNADDECQIIVTGSNAKMLSSELSTYLSGRYVEIHVQSLTYGEFLNFHELDDSPQSLEAYLTYGGLPHLRRIGLENVDMVWDYLQNIYNTIVLKDVVQREGLRNVTMFENLMRFVSDNVGQLVSANSISKFLKAQRIELTPLSTINYLKSAGNAYIVNKVSRYDIHGKRLLETIDKFYFEDIGLRNLLVGSDRAKDIEKVMENAVYLHLKSMGYTVAIGTLSNGEVDFVAEKGGRPIYVQVAHLMADDATVQREFGNLRQISDNYPKYVVTMDPLLAAKDWEGITQMHLRRFLLTQSL